MPTVDESGIEFAYAAAASFIKHDAVNSIWPGVDFIIDEGSSWIWIEVKNWEPSSLTALRRGGQRRSFLSKMRSKIYLRETLRGKFLGTSSYLVHTGVFVSKPLAYVVLLESPRMDSALMMHATQRLLQMIRPHGPWAHGISAAVVNLSEWNLRYADYPARAV